MDASQGRQCSKRASVTAPSKSTQTAQRPDPSSARRSSVRSLRPLASMPGARLCGLRCGCRETACRTTRRPRRRRWGALARDHSDGCMRRHATPDPNMSGWAVLGMVLASPPDVCRWHADVAQLVAHHLAKVRVAGSNPVVRSRGPTGFIRWSGREARQRPAKPSTRVRIPSPPRSTAAPLRCSGRLAQGLERYLDTVEATGSIPVSPTLNVQVKGLLWVDAHFVTQGARIWPFRRSCMTKVCTSEFSAKPGWVSASNYSSPPSSGATGWTEPRRGRRCRCSVAMRPCSLLSTRGWSSTAPTPPSSRRTSGPGNPQPAGTRRAPRD